ncbi:MAG: hypothetical protein GX419_04425 [Bacteroidales bacterium]|nr:hypothetical protein [Bacteroidales bacterium]
MNRLSGRFHCVSVGFVRMPTHKAYPLRIRSFALLMRNPGLTGRFHCVPAGFARMLPRKTSPLRISSFALLMRNPGLRK